MAQLQLNVRRCRLHTVAIDFTRKIIHRNPTLSLRQRRCLRPFRAVIYVAPGANELYNFTFIAVWSVQIVSDRSIIIVFIMLNSKIDAKSIDPNWQATNDLLSRQKTQNKLTNKINISSHTTSLDLDGNTTLIGQWTIRHSIAIL